MTSVSKEPSPIVQDSTREPNDWTGEILNVVLIALGLLGSCALVFTVASADIFPPWNSSVTNSDKGIGSGVFGDAFGFATSIFTGAAFLGLFMAMRLQRKELKEIRKERRIAQKTLRLQILQNKAVQEDVEQRRYEDRTFKLIDAIRQQATDPDLPGKIQAASSAFYRKYGDFDLLLSDFCKSKVSDKELRRRLTDLNTQPNFSALIGYMSIPEVIAALNAMEGAKLTQELFPILKNSMFAKNTDLMRLVALQNAIFDWAPPHLLAPFVNPDGINPAGVDRRYDGITDPFRDLLICLEKLGVDPDNYV